MSAAEIAVIVLAALVLAPMALLIGRLMLVAVVVAWVKWVRK